MGEPKRIQLQRTKGWRKPEGAVVVSRPSQWGNPYAVGRSRGAWVVYDDRIGEPVSDRYPTKAEAAGDAVGRYRAFLLKNPMGDLRPLAGRDLACWCPPGQPCHADVLLELANADG